MNYIQYMKPGGNFWALPNGLQDVSWSEFWNNWKQAIEKAKDQIIDNWENLKQDYKDAADPIAASERKQAESIEATRAKQASMKFVSDNRTDYEKKRDRNNFELKEFEQKEQLNKDATDAVMWTLTGPVYAVQHLASPNGVVKTYGNIKATVQNGGGPYLEKAVASAAGDVLDATIVGAPVWNAARPYAVGLYNTTNYSSLGNRLAHPIESLRFAKINTKLSDLVRQAYPKETAKFMLEEASPLFKTVRYYNKGNSGPLYIGGTDMPLLIEGLRNTPTTTVKMWDRAHEYGHLFDDALRRLDVGMARGSFGLSKEGISLVPKNYAYSPGVGVNTPRGQMEFMADNIASSLYPEPKHVGMLHGEVAPYLERLALAAQVPFGSMYVLNGRSHVPYFLPEYKNFGRFIPTSTQRGSLGKGYKLNAQDGHSILLDTEIKPQTIPTKTSLAFFERKPAKIPEAERLGIPKGDRGNLSRFQKEALEDLATYRNKWIHLKHPLLDNNGNIIWSNGTNKSFLDTYVAPLRGDQYKGVLLYPHIEDDGSYLMRMSMGSDDLNGGFAGYNGISEITLTSPKMNAINLEIPIPVEQASPTLPKDGVKTFWAALQDIALPGSYISGDFGGRPLGYNLIRQYNKIGTPIVSTTNTGVRTIIGRNGYLNVLNELFRKIPWKSHYDGLSTDSYMALLKLGNRPGYKLRFSKDGFTNWNHQSFENKYILDLYEQALTDPTKLQEFLKVFHDWVAPYGGHDAVIKNGKIIIPQPFIVRQKSGGSIKIKKKNIGSFTRYCKGKVTEECIRKGKNSSNPTTRKRANFAWVARHKFKHGEGGRVNYLNYFKHE